MSKSKEEYTDQVIWDFHRSVNEIRKQTNIVKDEVHGIQQDLQGLYHHLQELRQQQEKENG